MTIKNVREALAELNMVSQNLDDDSEIKHRFRRNVTGLVMIKGGDYVVKWSDSGGAWERLHSGDIGGRA